MDKSSIENVSYQEKFARSDIKPAFSQNNIPIVFGSDENYLPYLKVTLKSILSNTHDRNLDILIFHDSLTDEIQDNFILSITKQDNLSIRFVNINSFINATSCKLFQGEKDISVATLYKLFSPYVLTEYGKVLYLDTDIIVCNNIGNLFDIDLEDNLIGAARDIFFEKNSSKQDGYIEFAKKYGFEETNVYVNAGVILFNCFKFREQKDFSINQLVDIAIEALGYYADQDAINICCKEKIKIIPPQWNFLAIKGYVNEFRKQFDGEINIVHFARSVKPWNNVENIYAHYWWKYIGINDGKDLWRKIFDKEEEISIGNGICVSVVIPIYNAEQYIPMMLISLCAQTLTNIEIICVDDGSSDSSRFVCERFAKKDSRIKVINQVNSGAAVARNRGLDEAQGEWLIFVDADDFCKPNMLECMVHKGEKDLSDIVVVGYINANTKAETIINFKIPTKYFEKDSIINSQIREIDIFSGLQAAAWNKLYRRSFVVNGAYRFHNTPPSDDVFFVFGTLVNASRISLMNDSFYFYRTYQSGSQIGNVDKNYNNYLQAYREIYEEYLLNSDADLQEKFYIYVVKQCFWLLFRLNDFNARENVFNILRDGYFDLVCAPALKNKSMDFGFYNKVYDSLKNKGYLSEIFSIQYSELWNREIKANERINTLNDSIKQKIEQVTKLQEYIRNREQRISVLSENINKKELSIKQKVEQITKLQEYIRNREQRVASLLEKVNKKELQIDKLKKENNAMNINILELNKSIDKLINSLSYRLCRVITWPARKVYSLIRSVSR